ncbi:Gfo/Idh/MocA family oxidoreductase [Cryomorpha ignava]|uniref:Gfo/Idh/MocA family oxidoreductase n=1 Tax=Cryomorpha ignava TaxID=101383 RepID=A0A7K3WKN5_9FLAO|nr:Gfo/Idh/MocA family oxidoreductase [Cryomorpha ignava]NEN22199.1 Gfo/Idh/MocA family oxidoreductase [Cryomorpha ignava]
MLKIGVLGAGHLGKIHIKLLKQIADYELVGFFDPDPKVAADAAEKLGVKQFPSMDALIDAVDVVDIVTPTLGHYECAAKALKKSKHIFIEKPITNTIEEAKSLISLSQEANVQVQVGHVERFNPAFVAARDHFDNPMFIETHRLAQFNPRGTDVSVVLDLMIHDLDIVLSVVKSNIKRISASGVAIVSDEPDIASARLEFDNGCVANLTASRFSLKNMRKSRFFQRNAYISVDFLKRESEIVKMRDVEGEIDPFSMSIDLGEGKGVKEIFFEKPKIEENNAIKDELTAFAKAINTGTPPPVTIEDGYKALDIAYKIVDKLKKGNEY